MPLKRSISPTRRDSSVAARLSPQGSLAATTRHASVIAHATCWCDHHSPAAPTTPPPTAQRQYYTSPVRHSVTSALATKQRAVERRLPERSPFLSLPSNRTHALQPVIFIFPVAGSREINQAPVHGDDARRCQKTPTALCANAHNTHTHDNNKILKRQGQRHARRWHRLPEVALPSLHRVHDAQVRIHVQVHVQVTARVVCRPRHACDHTYTNTVNTQSVTQSAKTLVADDPHQYLPLLDASAHAGYPATQPPSHQRCHSESDCPSLRTATRTLPCGATAAPHHPRSTAPALETRTAPPQSGTRLSTRVARHRPTAQTAHGKSEIGPQNHGDPVPRSHLPGQTSTGWRDRCVK